MGTASETDFTGRLSGHGTHADDIVPPFTIENPGPDDPSSFPGQNWDDQGQPILNHGCESEPPAPEPPHPSTKLRICHASSSDSNPYVSQEPDIENNGDLSGGHLNHTGPVYPADGWGDIVPPYQYVDENGVLQTFSGYNWGEGQVIYQNGCDLPPEPITPVLECVEAAESGFLAHFGYTNPNATTIRPPLSQNYFAPGDADQGQPESFDHGAHSDVFQVSWNGSDLTWNLTGNSVTASSELHRCAGGSLTVNKHLLPTNDPGRFNLKIDGNIEGDGSEVGDGGTTGTIAVPSGIHTVGESASSGTSLNNYRVRIVIRGRRQRRHRRERGTSRRSMSRCRRARRSSARSRIRPGRTRGTSRPF